MSSGTTGNTQTESTKSKDPQIIIKLKNTKGQPINHIIYIDLWVYDKDGNKAHRGTGFTAGRVNEPTVEVGVDFFYNLEEWKRMSDAHETITCGYHVILRGEDKQSRIVETVDNLEIAVSNASHQDGMNKNSFFEDHEGKKENQPEFHYSPDGTDVYVHLPRKDDRADIPEGYAQRAHA